MAILTLEGVDWGVGKQLCVAAGSEPSPVPGQHWSISVFCPAAKEDLGICLSNQDAVALRDFLTTFIERTLPPLEISVAPMSVEAFREKWGEEPDVDRELSVADWEAMGDKGVDLLRVGIGLALASNGEEE